MEPGVVAPDLVWSESPLHECKPQSIGRYRCFSHVRRDHLVDAVNRLSVEDANVVNVGVAHSGGESGGPGAPEVELRRATARHELRPRLAVALDQKAVAVWRPAERV